jgi:hypothetical protein
MRRTLSAFFNSGGRRTFGCSHVSGLKTLYTPGSVRYFSIILMKMGLFRNC